MQENFLIKYRKANAKDAIHLADLRVRFLTEISENISKQEAVKLKAELTEYFHQELVGRNIIVWVAEMGKKIIATSTMVVWQSPIGFSGIGKNGSGYILNMFTLEEYRKCGIGTLLLGKLVNAAKLLNLEKVHLHATDDGVGLYKEMGFVPPVYPELVLKIDDYEKE